MKILVIPRGLTLLEKWGFLCLITRVCPWKINVWVCTFLGWRLCCHTTAAEVHLLHPAQGLWYMAAQPGPRTPSRCRGSQPQSRSHSPHPRWAMQPVQDWHCALRPCSIPLRDQVFLVKFICCQKIPVVSRAHTDKLSEDFSPRRWPANDYSGKWYYLINIVLKILIKRAVYFVKVKLYIYTHILLQKH